MNSDLPLVYENIKTLVTNAGLIKKQGRHPKHEDLSPIHDACIVVEKGKFAFVGTKDEFKKSKFFGKTLSIDCKNAYVFPGLIDSHTHLLYEGSRSNEWARLLAGEPYEKIYQSGGGIKSTMNATRNSKLEDRLENLTKRLMEWQSQGITTVEVKTSYALNEQDLNDYLALRANPFPTPAIIPTFMGLHALPPEFKSYDEYFDFVTKNLFPKLPKDAVVDIFVDKGFFTVEHLEKLCKLWPTKQIKVHGDELVDLGIVGFAAQKNLLSVDHCLKANDESIKKIAKSSTVATLLPGTALYLREPFARGREFFDSGAIVAIASDHNPGTCPMKNFWNILSVSCSQMKISVAEAFAGATYNAAQSLNIHAHKGAIQVGFDGDMVLFDEPLEEIFYNFGAISPREVFSSFYHQMLLH